MTEREAFKFGFLLYHAERGRPPAEAAARARGLAAALRGGPAPALVPAPGGEKAGFDAAAKAYDILSGLATAGAGAGYSTLKALLPASVILPATVGLGGGFLAGKALDPGYDADDVRRQELIAAYGQAADDMDEDLRTRRELGR